MDNFSDFKVWGFISILAVLFGSLLVGNMLKKGIKPLQKSLIPTSVLGGAVLLIVAAIYKWITGDVMFDTAFFNYNGTAMLELITYHTLALGFIASTFKSGKGKLTRERTVEILNTGVTTVSTYLMQGVLGLGITMIVALVIPGFFSAAGVLLPFGYGQGTGQALNYGNIFETDFGFVGGKTFGLTVAALGFLSASIGGVIHLQILKRKKNIIPASVDEEAPLRIEEVQADNEIPLQGGMDKMTVQIALVAVAYLVTYLLMLLLGNLLPGMRSVIYGFNFLLGVLAATLIKVLIRLLQKCRLSKRKYTNDFLMTRVSNFFFDVMVVAGIAAIRLGILEKYWGVILILGVVGFASTYLYEYFVAHTLFKAYKQEQFMMMYGMLTGTASTGIILLRELDSKFETPAADNMVYQNFPAIVLGFPIMFLATLAPTRPGLVLFILAAFFAVLNVFLFRSKIFKRKK